MFSYENAEIYLSEDGDEYEVYGESAQGHCFVPRAGKGKVGQATCEYE